MSHSGDHESTLPPWRAEVLDPARPADAARIDALRRQAGIRVVDTLAAQRADLAAARHPGGWPSEAARRAAWLATADEGEGPRPDDLVGRWVHYPWAGVLVRLLGPGAFRELRLDRQRDKVTREEQDRLARATIGVVGLSVGAAVAVLLAQDGVGGHLRLADMDHLELSNLNRVRAPVWDVGLPKVVVAARRIAEIDPYVTVSIEPRGFSAETAEAFLDGPPRLDAVVELCDALDAKIRVRELARARGLPVVMETSDRGLLDVERFDEEPERPLLHGRLEGLTADGVAALSPEERMGVVLRIVRPDEASERMLASLPQLGRTLSSWPQLGTEVALGGVTVTTALRRLLCHRPLPSGRRVVDISALVAGEEVR